MTSTAFFKTVTVRKFSWRGRLILTAAIALVLWFSFPLVVNAVTAFIVDDDGPRPTEHIVLENWDSSFSFFRDAYAATRHAPDAVIYTTLYDTHAADSSVLHFTKVAAAAAGFDTAALHLLIIPMKEPKTLHLGKTIIDTAKHMGWKEFTLVTARMHSARSKKCCRIFAEPAGISISTIGLGTYEIDPKDWTKTSNGWSFAVAETIKRLYYEIIVFPFVTP